MSIAYNAERGEVPLIVGGVELVIAAEMARLAQLSTKLGNPGFSEMYSRLGGAEINATMAGIESLAIKGDVEKALKEMTLADLPACTTAFVKVFAHHAEKAAGNAKAAKETQKSPGGSGSDSQA